MTTDTRASAFGATLQTERPRQVCVSGTASTPGTVTGWLSQDILLECLFEQTNSGVKIEEQVLAAGSAIMKLRRISGLKWEQLARLLGVTPRSLHFWASGKTLNAENEEHLRRVLATVERIDRGVSSENRGLLLSASGDGSTFLDLLAAKRYDEVLEGIGSGVTQRRPELASLSQSSRVSRTPPRPNELVGALQDAVHVSRGRLISAVPVRTKR